MDWKSESFGILTSEGEKTVTGLVSDVFGIYGAGERREHWVVTHIPTGLKLTAGNGFLMVESAKRFVEKISRKADWKTLGPDNPPPDLGIAVAEIWNEMIVEDCRLMGAIPIIDQSPWPSDENPSNMSVGTIRAPAGSGRNTRDAVCSEFRKDCHTAMPMTQVASYIGDDAFKAFLSEHGCRASFEEIRMRFLGAQVSPGRDADIYLLVEDLFEYDMPELPDGSALEAFLHTFLGLWNAVAESSQHSPITLSPVGPVSTRGEIKDLLYRRIDEVVFGFLEGVWGDEDELPLTEARAAMLTAMEEAARPYQGWLLEVVRNEATGAETPVAERLHEICKVDERIEEAITSLVEAFRIDPSSDHPKMMRANALIDALVHSEGLPREAIRQCIARQDEMVPIFLGILHGYVDDRYSFDDRDGALFFIIHIMAELGERRAFAPLMDLLDGDPARVEGVLGDAITENLTQILISVFDGDTDRLYNVMNNPDADEFLRSAVFEAWTYFVAAGRIDRLEAEQYLSSCFETLQPQEEHYVWNTWVEAVAHLGFAGHTGTVRKAFELGRIPPMTILFDEFEEILEATLQADDLVALPKKKRMHPFSDVIGVLSQWYGFSDEFLQKEKDVEFAKRQPIQVINTITNLYRNVGRNDPCPCGSEKKYKKCCLQ